MGHSFLIRDGVGSDAASVEAVHWASRNAAYSHVRGWPPDRPNLAERIELWHQWLTDPAIVSLVAEVRGMILGVCTVRPSTDEDLDNSRVAEIPTLYVHPEFWHRGLGRSLCAAALERATAAGFESLALWSVESNTRADEFYREFGFVRDVTKIMEWSFEPLVVRRYRIALHPIGRAAI
jgi:ribosomal protein S18 acetylase RimI-like enzyme